MKAGRSVQTRVALVGAVLLLAACGKKPAATGPTETGLTIALQASTLPNGASSNVQATAVFSDKSTQDVTLQATWGSNDPSVLTVTECTSIPCQVIANGVGTATLTASYNGFTATASVTVTNTALTSLAAFAGTTQLPVGATTQIDAVGTYSDGSSFDVTQTVAWTSSQPDFVSLNGAIATGLQQGTSKITATLNDQSASIMITVVPPTVVSLSILPEAVAIPVSGSQTFTLIANMSDHSTQDVSSTATWSLTGNAASITSGSTVEGVSPGTTSVGALYETFAPGASVPVVFSAAEEVSIITTEVTGLSIDQANPTLIAGQTQQLTTTGMYDGGPGDVTEETVWSSSNPAVVSVGNGAHSGLLTSFQAGTATITASIGSVQSTVTVTVNPVTPVSFTISAASGNNSINAGTTDQIDAVAINNDGSTDDVTRQVSWGVDQSTLATISAMGLLSALQAGTVTVTANLGDLPQETLQVTINPAVLTSLTVAAPGAVKVGTNAQMTATANYMNGDSVDATAACTWAVIAGRGASGGNATISASGLLTPTASGTVTVTATIGTKTGSLILAIQKGS